MEGPVVIELIDLSSMSLYDLLRRKMDLEHKINIQYALDKWYFLKRWVENEVGMIIPERMRGDKEVMKQLLITDPDAARFASKELRNDKEFISFSLSIQRGPYYRVHAGFQLLDDEDFILEVAKQYNCTDWLNRISARLLADKEFILKLLNIDMSPDQLQTGYLLILEYVSDELRDDKDVVIAACSRWGNAMQYVSARLRSDIDVITLACKNDGRALKYIFRTYHDIGDDGNVRDNKEIVMSACSNYGKALEYASKRLRGDHDVVAAACTNDGSALYWASSNCKWTKRIVILACKSAGREALRFANVHFRKDPVLLEICQEFYNKQHKH